LIPSKIPPTCISEPLRVRRLNEQDARSIAEFFRAAGWDDGATDEGVREMFRTAAVDNPFEPGEAPPIVGAFFGTRLVGYISTIPTQFWTGKESTTAYWFKGLWVLEEHRNTPIAVLLMKEIFRHVDLAASMPGEPLARQLSKALGMLDLGAVCDYIEPLRPTHILRKFDVRRFEHLSVLPRAGSAAIKLAKMPPFAYAIGALISLGLTVLRLPSTLTGRKLTTQIGASLPSEATIDSLWTRARRNLECSPVRSSAYLRWRYERGATGRYCFASAWHGDDMVGLAVLASPQRHDDSRIAGLSIGTVVDLVLDPDCSAALPSLLRVARQWARAANYDALLLTASHHSLRGPLRRAGYIRLPGNIHVMLRDPRGKYGVSTNLDNWLLTRGDACGDQL
jgi:GNAT superfamily N-acetyltransferase